MSCSAAQALSRRRVEARRLTLVFTQPSASFGFTALRFFGISVSTDSGLPVSILTRLSVVVMDVATLRRVRSVPFDAGLHRFRFFNISVFRFCGYAYPTWFRSLPSSSSSSSLLRSPATACRSWSISSSFRAICALMPAGSSRGGIRAPAFGDVATMFMIQGRTPRHETGRRADLRQGRCTCRYRKRRLWPLTRTGTNGMTPDTTCVRSGIRRGSV